MSEQQSQFEPPAELPPRQTTESTIESLPEFSGKYVALALFVGIVQFYWMNSEEFLLGFSISPASLMSSLAQGALVTIAALALYGRWNGKPFFREPGHWLALVVVLPWMGALMDSLTPLPGTEHSREIGFICLEFLQLVCNLANAVLGVLFLKWFVSGSEVFDSGAWRAVLLFIGFGLAFPVLFALGVTIGWVGYSELHTATRRAGVVGLVAGFAVCAALVGDIRRNKQRHWTHTTAVYCWLAVCFIREYWRFRPELESLLGP